jgi:hypothetical protein
MSDVRLAELTPYVLDYWAHGTPGELLHALKAERAHLAHISAERDALMTEHEANGSALDDSCNRHGCSEDECDGWDGCTIRVWATAHDAAQAVLDLSRYAASE